MVMHLKLKQNNKESENRNKELIAIRSDKDRKMQTAVKKFHS
jgi:hypothetical protein